MQAPPKLFDAGRFQEAEPVYRKLLALNPDDPIVRSLDAAADRLELVAHGAHRIVVLCEAVRVHEAVRRAALEHFTDDERSHIEAVMRRHFDLDEDTAQELIAPDNPWGFKLEVPPHKFNRGELHNLSIARGTLTAEERVRAGEEIGIHPQLQDSAAESPRTFATYADFERWRRDRSDP